MIVINLMKKSRRLKPTPVKVNHHVSIMLCYNLIIKIICCISCAGQQAKKGYLHWKKKNLERALRSSAKGASLPSKPYFIQKNKNI